MKLIKVPLKLFNPNGIGAWYIWEWDGKHLLFGVCELFCREVGYVSLKELKDLDCGNGLKVERDINWNPETIADDILEGKVH